MEKGLRVEKLVVVGERPRNRFGERVWRLRCDCGREQDVPQSKARHKYSCGTCCRPPRKHGLCKTPEYGVWNDIKKRCYNPKYKCYADYGGRGIMVCKRWRDSFAAFYADMGPRPDAGHQIERIDNDGNYKPGNCCWATRHDQTRNKRNNVWLTLNGRTQILQDWANEQGRSPKLLQDRKRLGWNDEDILTLPAGCRRKG